MSEEEEDPWEKELAAENYGVVDDDILEKIIEEKTSEGTDDE